MSKVRMLVFVCSLIFAILLISQIVAAQSIWQKIKQQTQQQAGQAQQQKPQKPAQQNPQQSQQPQNNDQANDTGPFTPPPGTKIEPVVMAPVEQGAQFAVSPTGVHVATVSHSGSRGVIIYDGAAGPKFDQFFMESGGGNPVIFSPDGSRWTYCGQIGSDWVVMLDGKELARGSNTVNGAMGTNSCTLGFTSNSKHLFFTTAESTSASSSAVRFVFDGKAASPLGADADMRLYAFSPDGNHVAYFVGSTDPSNTAPGKLWIDGKPAPYDAGSPQWSADSQHLFTMRITRVADPRIGSVQDFLYDGKPFMRVDNARLFIPPVGNMVVAVVSRTHVNPPMQFLVVGGKEVPGSEVAGSINNVTFSPDGKHYAAAFHNANNRSYVIFDGKKGLEYPSVTDLAYTADSSKFFYQGYDTSSGARYFVINGEESDRIPSWTETVYSPVGGHVATDGSGFVTMDGQILKLPNVNPQTVQASALGFSPDASHFAFVLHDHGGMILYLDGVAQTAYGVVNGGPLTNISTRPYIWSPDSKHVAYFCRSSNPAANNDIYLCLDDKAVRLGGPGYYANLTFSGDGNHLFWTKNKPLGEIRIFADGKPVQDGFPVSTAGFQKETWQIGPDGNLLVLLQVDNSLDRIAITPASNSNISTWFAGSSSLSTSAMLH